MIDCFVSSHICTRLLAKIEGSIHLHSSLCFSHFSGSHGSRALYAAVVHHGCCSCIVLCLVLLFCVVDRSGTPIF